MLINVNKLACSRVGLRSKHVRKFRLLSKPPPPYAVGISILSVIESENRRYKYFRFWRPYCYFQLSVVNAFAGHTIVDLLFQGILFCTGSALNARKKDVARYCSF